MITPNSTGAGGSSKILFRGNKSISGNNQPLVVVDGVPVMMNITNSQVDSNYGGQRDGGDAMSTINPDDIAPNHFAERCIGSSALWCGSSQWRHYDYHQISTVG